MKKTTKKNQKKTQPKSKVLNLDGFVGSAATDSIQNLS